MKNIILIFTLFFLPIFTFCIAHGNENFVPFSLHNEDVNEALITLYEGNPEIWNEEQRYLIGLCYITQKKYNEAISIFQSIKNNNAFRIRSSRAIGNILSIKGDKLAAIKVYRKAWNADKDVLSLEALGALLLNSGDMEELESILKDLVDNQGKSLDIKKILLSYSIKTSDLNKSADIYKSVVDRLSEDELRDDEVLRKLFELASLRFTDKENGGGPKVPIKTED